MDSTTPPSPDLTFDHLRALKVVGKGAMGTVFLVYDTVADPRARYPFALKVVDKSGLLNKLDADRRARWEIHVLSRLAHPFLPSLLGTFENHQFLAWATPYCPGGDLNVLRYRQSDGVFAPAVIRFYLAEIICALDHIHSLGIAYRDLKPENVLVQQSGHVTLTDFDLSRNLTPKTIPPNLSNNRSKHRRNFTRWIPVPPDVINGRKSLKKIRSAKVIPVSRRKPSFSNGERSNSFVGTEEYVSPEVVRGEGHEFAVDWWSLGILAYEMMYGTTPFKGNNRKETFRNVVTRTPVLVGKPTTLTDLIQRLLHKEPTKRLGYVRGASEIKEHEFFRGVRWDLLTEVVRPPFIPSKEDGDWSRGSGVEIEIGEYFERLGSATSSLTASTEKVRDISIFNRILTQRNARGG